MAKKRRGFQKGRRKTGGRKRGVRNKATREAKGFAESVISSVEYQDRIRARALRGDLAPALEVLLWHHTIGKPPDHVTHSGSIATLDPQKLKGLTDEQLEQLAAGCRLAQQLITGATQ